MRINTFLLLTMLLNGFSQFHFTELAELLMRIDVYETILLIDAWGWKRLYYAFWVRWNRHAL